MSMEEQYKKFVAEGVIPSTPCVIGRFEGPESERPVSPALWFSIQDPFTNTNNHLSYTSLDPYTCSIPCLLQQENQNKRPN